MFKQRKAKNTNDKAVSLLTRELGAIGYQEIENGLLRNEHLTLKILDQRYDGIELYVKYSYGSARIDSMLEYYLSKEVELSRKRYRKKITQIEFFIQMLKQFTAELSTDEGVMKPYQEWKLNPKPHFEEIGEMIFRK